MESLYPDKIKKDLNIFKDGKLTKWEFQIYLVQQMIEIMKDLSNVNIGLINNRRFPFSFSFHYTYFYRYAVNGHTVTINDLFDLMNSQLVVIVDRYYGDASFAATIRKLARKRPMTQKSLLDGFIMRGIKEPFSAMNVQSDELGVSDCFFENCQVFSIRDLRKEI